MSLRITQLGRNGFKFLLILIHVYSIFVMYKNSGLYKIGKISKY